MSFSLVTCVSYHRTGWLQSICYQTRIFLGKFYGWASNFMSWTKSCDRLMYNSHRFWLKLVIPHCPNMGNKIRSKVTGYMTANNISRTAVPISRRSSTKNLNQSETICVKCSYMPVVCACATTIYKSQESTYAEVVYEYDKRHAQSLLYVALSRVTDLQGLFIFNKNDEDLTFCHGR